MHTRDLIFGIDPLAYTDNHGPFFLTVARERLLDAATWILRGTSLDHSTRFTFITLHDLEESRSGSIGNVLLWVLYVKPCAADANVPPWLARDMVSMTRLFDGVILRHQPSTFAAY